MTLNLKHGVIHLKVVFSSKKEGQRSENTLQFKTEILNPCYEKIQNIQ